MSTAAWDDDFITECLARGEAKRSIFQSEPEPHWRCHWCGHAHTGLPCTSCRCDSATTSRDDSWRPNSVGGSPLDRDTRNLADKCGVDGWTARAGVPENSSLAEQTRALKVRRFLLTASTPAPTSTPPPIPWSS